MRIQDRPNLGLNPGVPVPFVQRLHDILAAISTKLNQVALGTAEGFDGKATAIPTVGTYAQGDRIRHAAPVEAGAPGSMYVVIGWVCIAGGSPGTWREMRVLTGN